MGTTTAQKKLFFNLKKIKNQLSIKSTGDMKPKHVEEISQRLNVDKEEVVNMNRRLYAKEKSLNDPINDRWPGFDDGVYAGARMLEILSESEGEDIFSALPKLISTPEINLKTTDEEKFIIIDEFKKISNFDKGKIIEIDGIRVEFDDGWGLLRASNTSPVLVLRFEADSSKALNHIKDRFKDTLYKIEPSLTNF